MTGIITATEAAKALQATHGRRIVFATPYQGFSAKNSFRCTVCGHTWQMVCTYTIRYGKGCAKCAHRNLRQGDAAIQARIDAQHGGTVRLIGAYTQINDKHQFRCDKGHAFEARLNHVVRGAIGCGECRFAAKRQEVQAQIDGVHGAGVVTLLGDYVGTARKHRFRCAEGHEWETKPNSIIFRQSGCPQCNSARRYSPVAIEWLSKMQKHERRAIRHGDNGGEVTIEVDGKKLRPDGYNARTRTVYEFHGDVYHGNPGRFKPTDCPHPFRRGVTARQLWQETRKRERQLVAAGYTVVAVWEADYRAGQLVSYRLTPSQHWQRE